MGKVSGLTSSRKRHRKAPPAKVTPEKDEELVADDVSFVGVCCVAPARPKSGRSRQIASQPAARQAPAI